MPEDLLHASQKEEIAAPTVRKKSSRSYYGPYWCCSRAPPTDDDGFGAPTKRINPLAKANSASDDDEGDTTDDAGAAK